MKCKRAIPYPNPTSDRPYIFLFRFSLLPWKLIRRHKTVLLDFHSLDIIRRILTARNEKKIIYGKN